MHDIPARGAEPAHQHLDLRYLVVAPPDAVASLRQELAHRDKLAQLVSRIHAAKNLDTLFIELKQDMLDLLDAERMTFYAVDRERREIYSRFIDIDTASSSAAQPPAARQLPFDL